MDSYERLEASSLEAVESLNATVEAKDPDTAGHSRRVQRVALAIGAQLDLSAQQLDAFRLGALFHDIGKIAVPDGILVKPGTLDHREYALMKTHPAEGAWIGLADSWDAMTTDRPYHRALTHTEALAQVRAGRGTQFSPVVADAFFAVLELQPAELGVDDRFLGAV